MEIDKHRVKAFVFNMFGSTHWYLPWTDRSLWVLHLRLLLSLIINPLLLNSSLNLLILWVAQLGRSNRKSSWIYWSILVMDRLLRWGKNGASAEDGTHGLIRISERWWPLKNWRSHGIKRLRTIIRALSIDWKLIVLVIHRGRFLYIQVLTLWRRWAYDSRFWGMWCCNTSRIIGSLRIFGNVYRSEVSVVGLRLRHGNCPRKIRLSNFANLFKVIICLFLKSQFRLLCLAMSAIRWFNR